MPYKSLKDRMPAFEKIVEDIKILNAFQDEVEDKISQLDMDKEEITESEILRDLPLTPLGLKMGRKRGYLTQKNTLTRQKRYSPKEILRYCLKFSGLADISGIRTEGRKNKITSIERDWIRAQLSARNKN